ncbi:MAG: hypothetical protein QM754_07540 [Tepidisphaeraceae bacterium]
MPIPKKLAGLLLSMSLTTGAFAETRMVAFGGGSSPQNDQQSLLSNVHYFDRVRKILSLDKTPFEVYFADAGKNAVVQASAKDDEHQQLVNLVGMLLYNSNSTRLRFNKVDRGDIAGEATTENLAKWFDATKDKLKPKDRLIFYFTGHGGGERFNTVSPRNTTMYMWGKNEGYPMREFVKQLDKLDPAVETTLIMVQCYSGGFANVIYKDGDPEKGLSDHLRAGFFSTVASRMAAGCTPEIDEDDYEEFSTSFFEALCGQSRTGKKVDGADYDHNGTVTYNEAFAWTVLTSSTIDIPVCTSDQLLRDKSRYFKDGDSAGVLPKEAAWPAVIAAASPSEKAMLEGLSEQLGLTGDDRLAAAGQMAERLDQEMRPPQMQRGPMNATSRSTTGPTSRPMFNRGQNQQQPVDPARQRLQQAILTRWPQLAIPLSPQAIETLDKEWKEIETTLKAQPEYERFANMMKQNRERSDARQAVELKWVKTQRLLERAASVILAKNLPQVADAATVKAFETLKRMEGGNLNTAE